MTPSLTPLDRDALGTLSLEALREHALELGIAGDPEAMDRAALEHALGERLAGLEPGSSAAWQRRLHRPPEPEIGIYIDRGPPVPDFYAGNRLRVMARDARTVFVYWESDEDAPEGWQVTAYDGDDSAIGSFRTPSGRHRSGYLEVGDLGRVARVALARLVDGRPRAQWSLDVRLTGRGLRTGERWIDIRSGAAGQEAPAEGALPRRAARAGAGLSSLEAMRVGQSWLPSSGALPGAPLGTTREPST